MKIRTSFVSNSSSTSFCIVGISHIEIEEKYGRDKIDEYDDKKIDWKNEIKKYGYEQTLYIGIPIENMKDNETLADFKKRVSIKLSHIFGDSWGQNDMRIIQESWYDG